MKWNQLSKAQRMCVHNHGSTTTLSRVKPGVGREHCRDGDFRACGSFILSSIFPHWLLGYVHLSQGLLPLTGFLMQDSSGKIMKEEFAKALYSRHSPAVTSTCPQPSHFTSPNPRSLFMSRGNNSTHWSI